MKIALEINGTEALAFIQTLDQCHLVSIHPDCGEIRGLDFGTESERAIEWAAKENSVGRNVYWTVNYVRPGRNKKPAKNDIVAARFAHVDIDPPKGTDSWDRNSAFEALENCSRPPSFVVDSGNGLQAFWRLDEPCENWKFVEAVNLQIREKFEADACHNIDRLMRLPGLVNWPDAKKRAAGRVPALASIVAADEGEVFQPADLAAQFPKSQQVVAEAKDGTAVFVAPPENIVPLTAKTLGLWDGHPLEKALAMQGEDRSAHGHLVIRDAVQWLLPDEAIFALMLNPAIPAAAHYVEKGGIRGVRRSIASARAEYCIPSPAEFFQADIPAVQEALKNMKLNAANDLKSNFELRDMPANEASWGAGKSDWLATMPPGPMRDYIHAVLDSSIYPQPEITLASALTMFGACLGRRYKLNVGPSGLYSNIYSMGLLASARGKDAPLKAATRTLEDAEQGNIIGGSKIVSDQGLLKAVAASPVIYYGLDEVSALIHAMLDSKSGGWEKMIATRLTELWSAAGSTWRGSDRADGRTDPICNPHVCLFGITTQSELFSAVITKAAFARGTLPRFLVFEGDPMVMPTTDLFGVKPFVAPESVLASIRRLRELNPSQLPDSNVTMAKFKMIEFSDDAKQLGREGMADQNERQLALLAKGDEGSQAIIGREMEHAFKIAMILAATTDPENPMVTANHLEWALGISRRNTTTLIHLLMNQTAETGFDRKTKALESLIRKSGKSGLTRTQIARAIGGEPRSRDDMLRSLLDAGQVYHAQTPSGPKGGAPQNRYWHRDFVQG